MCLLINCQGESVLHSFRVGLEPTLLKISTFLLCHINLVRYELGTCYLFSPIPISILQPISSFYLNTLVTISQIIKPDCVLISFISNSFLDSTISDSVCVGDWRLRTISEWEDKKSNKKQNNRK